MNLFNATYDFFKKLDFSDSNSAYLSLIINFTILIIVAYLLDFLCKRLFTVLLSHLAAKTKSTFDDILVSNKTAKYLAHLVPLLFVINLSQYFLKVTPIGNLFLKKE